MYRAEEIDTGAELELLTLPRVSETRHPGESTSLDLLWAQLCRARGINHPNVAKVNAVGTLPDGTRCVALEVLRGDPLSELLKVWAPLSPSEAAGFILQASRGLQAAHAKSVLHGAISPASIVITRSEQDQPLVKLVGFGGSARREYAAPEQLSGHQGSVQSDIYSMGAVLYHLLTGEPPDPELGRDDRVPKVIRPVVAKALNHVPKRRFGTAGALVQALEAVSET